MEQMNRFLFPGGAGHMREATRRLCDGNTAKHSESFCPLFPCLSRHRPYTRGGNVAEKGLYMAGCVYNGAQKRPLRG
jgi:hypothetical protein